MNSKEVHYKIYLCAVGFEPEVRRITIDKDIYCNYFYLKQKLMKIFPALKADLFTVSWKDVEGDMVRICSDEELTIAMEEMSSMPYKKLYVATESRQEGVSHPNISCDGCDREIKGFRYKCVVCMDYDLCPDCERACVHPEHIMLRIPFPISKDSPFKKRFGRDLHRMSKHFDQMNIGEKRGDGDGGCTSSPSTSRSDAKGEKIGNRREKKCKPGCPLTVVGPQLIDFLFTPMGATGISEDTIKTLTDIVKDGVWSFLDPLGGQGAQGNGGQNQGAQGNGGQNQGAQGNGQNQGAQGNGDQNQGAQGNGDQSQGAQGNGDQSQGAQGNGDQSQGAQGNGDQSQGTQGNGDQSQGAQGNGDQSQGTQGNGGTEAPNEASCAQPSNNQKEEMKDQPGPSRQPRKIFEFTTPQVPIMSSAFPIGFQPSSVASPPFPMAFQPSSMTPPFPMAFQPSSIPSQPGMMYPMFAQPGVQPEPPQFNPSHPGLKIRTDKHPMPPSIIPQSTEAVVGPGIRVGPGMAIPATLIRDNIDGSPVIDGSWTVINKSSDVAKDMSASSSEAGSESSGSAPTENSSAPTYPAFVAAENQSGPHIHQAIPVFPINSAGQNTVEGTLKMLLDMGFVDQDGWLRALVEEKKGSLEETLRFLSPIPKNPRPE